jgi:hypothetical protein
MKIVLSMNLYLFGIRHLKFNCILIYVLFYLILLNPNFCWAQTISGDEKLSGKWNINLHHNAVGNAQFLIVLKPTKMNLKHIPERMQIGTFLAFGPLYYLGLLQKISKKVVF